MTWDTVDACKDQARPEFAGSGNSMLGQLRKRSKIVDSHR
jgi:hypothetical protein